MMFHESHIELNIRLKDRLENNIDILKLIFIVRICVREKKNCITRQPIHLTQMHLKNIENTIITFNRMTK